VARIGIKAVMAVVRRVLAGVFALTWFIWPGYGLVDLSVTWDPEWPQVLEAGWGLYMTVFVGVPFTVIAVGKGASRLAAATQLYVAACALIVSAVPALEWQLVLLGIVVAAEIVIVAGLASPRDLRLIVNPSTAAADDTGRTWRDPVAGLRHSNVGTQPSRAH
jgi:hypothetical protein